MNTTRTAHEQVKAKVEMYSTAMCPYCLRAKMLLENKGVEIIELRVDLDRELRQEMIRRSNRRSVPQIFIDNTHIGGFDELSGLEFNESLDPLLGLANARNTIYPT